ncbi:RNA polymerase sigma factor [Candidatus Moduliflexus flocculans]|uniref:RNA polymerase sigma factor n=1 Tax=Candidatus Moduliflexus flocculans TaxID=1499966 RepID=A0A0S6W3V4_9BACT|nr:RNA polymerase sigma factor [Candidatus Moduliflexus flocculans]
MFNERKFDDDQLVSAAQQGNQPALEQLILRHQRWIYNIAIRMVGNPRDAEDVTQEILLKLIAKLNTFQRKSSFRTWLYRITAHHVLDMKKRPQEERFVSFERLGALIDQTSDEEYLDARMASPDSAILVEDTRIRCMMGMLLCLDRSQRLVFILGVIYGVTAQFGGDVLEISPENFRQQLARARKQLFNFMDEKCGLVKPTNPCRCIRKTRAAIAAGRVDPEHLQFYSQHLHSAKTMAAQHVQTVTLDDIARLRDQQFFQNQPF